MPTIKPQKSVNLDPEDHKLAQALADELTARNRRATGNPKLPATTLRLAVQLAIAHLADNLHVQSDAKK